MKLVATRVCLFVAAAPFALGQAATPAHTDTKSPLPAPSAKPAAPGSGKRAACKEASGKLRGMERTDSIQICMAEGRLACVKEAVAQKMPVAKRKDFLKTCLGD